MTNSLGFCYIRNPQVCPRPHQARPNQPNLTLTYFWLVFSTWSLKIWDCNSNGFAYSRNSWGPYGEMPSWASSLECWKDRFRMRPIFKSGFLEKIYREMTEQNIFRSSFFCESRSIKIHEIFAVSKTMNLSDKNLARE